MKNKKKILIGIVIAIVVVLVVLFLMFYKKKILNNFVKNIEYDIKIGKIEELTPDGGYASETTYRLINLEKRKLYIVKDYYVYGNEPNEMKKGHNYTVKIKKLSDEQIEKVKQLYDAKSDNIENTTDKIFPRYLKNQYYWAIEYQEKEIKLNNLPFVDDLW